MIRALALHAVGYKSRSNFRFGFVSGYPGFNSTTLCKEPTGCLLSVGVSVKFELFLSDG